MSECSKLETYIQNDLAKLFCNCFTLMCLQFFLMNDFLYFMCLQRNAWHDTTNEKVKSEGIIWKRFYNTLRVYLNQELVKLFLREQEFY